MPTVLVVIIADGTTPTTGQSFLLTCSISGAEKLNSVITYRWTKNNGMQTHVGTNSNTLSFLSLRLSDKGQYICQATVRSDYLSRAIEVSSGPFELQIPSK